MTNNPTANLSMETTRTFAGTGPGTATATTTTKTTTTTTITTITTTTTLDTTTNTTSDTTRGCYPFKPRWLSVESYGLLITFFAAMLFSGMGCFVKLAVGTGMSSTELVFARAVFQGSFIVLAMFQWKAKTVAQGYPGPHDHDDSPSSSSSSLFQQQQQPPPKPLIWTPLGGTRQVQKVVLLRGAIGGIGFIFYFYSIKSLPLGDAIALFSLYPIVSIFLAHFYLKEPIRASHLIATFTSVIGSIFIAQPTFLKNIGRKPMFHPTMTNDYDASSMSSTTTSSSSIELISSSSSPFYPTDTKPFGIAAALLGSVCGATVIVLTRKGGRVGAHTLQLIFSWASFGILFSLLCGPLFSSILHIDQPWTYPSFLVRNKMYAVENPIVWWYILGMGCIGSLAHFLFNYSGRIAPAGLVAITRSSDIMWAYGWEILIFHQVPSTTTLIGVALICIALAMIAIQKVSEEKQRQEESQKQKQLDIHGDNNEVSHKAEHVSLLVAHDQTYGSMNGHK